MDTLHHAEPLTPAAFLRRSALVHGDRLAVLDGERRFTYEQLYDRARRLAGLVRQLDIAAGDRVAVLAPNTSMALEASQAAPLGGFVLVALNIRLAPAELAQIVNHAGARLLLFDSSLQSTARALEQQVDGALQLVEDSGEDGAYELALTTAHPHERRLPDEWELLSLNYTSGTTGRPKGVMYHHRGAYLQALAMAYHTGLAPDSAYLWTLPMFHCNGWCFPWGVTAAGATHVCMRDVEPARAWRHFREDGITHLCAAPTVLNGIVSEPTAARLEDGRVIRVATGGAPPSPALLERSARLGIDVLHLYGLTETFGPSVVCDWRPEWNALDGERIAALKARQGVSNVIGERVRVVDPGGGDVPADGQTMGEIVIRGNNVMLGYYRDPEATQAALLDGHFRTGDLAVMHPDGYVEVRDRAKDIIISGGENIASVEVEQALDSHPAVLESAVVAMPDERWGEVPVAFVTLREGASADAEELREHVRGRLARFKAPKQITFQALPKTSTGKVQKYELRRQLEAPPVIDLLGPGD